MKDKYFFHHLNSRFFEISGKDSKLFIEVEKKKYEIKLINKPLKQTSFKCN